MSDHWSLQEEEKYNIRKSQREHLGTLQTNANVSPPEIIDLTEDPDPSGYYPENGILDSSQDFDRRLAKQQEIEMGNPGNTKLTYDQLEDHQRSEDFTNMSCDKDYSPNESSIQENEELVSQEELDIANEKIKQLTWDLRSKDLDFELKEQETKKEWNKEKKSFLEQWAKESETEREQWAKEREQWTKEREQWIKEREMDGERWTKERETERKENDKAKKMLQDANDRLTCQLEGLKILQSYAKQQQAEEREAVDRKESLLLETKDQEKKEWMTLQKTLQSQIETLERDNESLKLELGRQGESKETSDEANSQESAELRNLKWKLQHQLSVNQNHKAEVEQIQKELQSSQDQCKDLNIQLSKSSNLSILKEREQKENILRLTDDLNDIREELRHCKICLIDFQSKINQECLSEGEEKNDSGGRELLVELNEDLVREIKTFREDLKQSLPAAIEAKKKVTDFYKVHSQEQSERIREITDNLERSESEVKGLKLQIDQLEASSENLKSKLLKETTEDDVDKLHLTEKVEEANLQQQQQQEENGDNFEQQELKTITQESEELKAEILYQKELALKREKEHEKEVDYMNKQKRKLKEDYEQLNKKFIEQQHDWRDERKTLLEVKNLEKKTLLVKKMRQEAKENDVMISDKTITNILAERKNVNNIEPPLEKKESTVRFKKELQHKQQRIDELEHKVVRREALANQMKEYCENKKIQLKTANEQIFSLSHKLSIRDAILASIIDCVENLETIEATNQESIDFFASAMLQEENS